MAGRPVPFANIPHRRRLFFADIQSLFTARMKAAPIGRIREIRRRTAKAFFQGFIAYDRQGAYKVLCIGMLRTAENNIRRSFFHNATGIHYRHPLRYIGMNRHIVSYQEDCVFGYPLDLLEELQDTPLNHYV